MQEIRFHGRGGQGAVIGSEVLAQAFFLENKYVQAFPAFGVERRGAPVTAFCRVDDQHIYLRNQIYTPDHVVVLDSSLLKTGGVTQGLKKCGTIVVNGRRPPQHYRQLLGDDRRVHLCQVLAGIRLEFADAAAAAEANLPAIMVVDDRITHAAQLCFRDRTGGQGVGVANR